jgi:hypothetical protein
MLCASFFGLEDHLPTFWRILLEQSTKYKHSGIWWEVGVHSWQWPIHQGLNMKGNLLEESMYSKLDKLVD